MDSVGVKALDHINIVVDDLDAAAQFYGELLSLTSGEVPPPMTRKQVQWMYDADGHPVIHLNASDCPRAFDRDLSPGPTGALHHVAFNCSGYTEVQRRVAGLGVSHQTNEVDSIGLKQIFVHDPNGILLELNFRDG